MVVRAARRELYSESVMVVDVSVSGEVESACCDGVLGSVFSVFSEDDKLLESVAEVPGDLAAFVSRVNRNCCCSSRN